MTTSVIYIYNKNTWKNKKSLRLTEVNGQIIKKEQRQKQYTENPQKRDANIQNTFENISYLQAQLISDDEARAPFQSLLSWKATGINEILPEAWK